MSQGTFEDGGEEAEGHESEDMATGAGPEEPSAEPLKYHGDPLDDVDLEPPSS